MRRKLFVIDDFAPQGSGTDVARYHAAADRVFAQPETMLVAAAWTPPPSCGSQNHRAR